MTDTMAHSTGYVVAAYAGWERVDQPQWADFLASGEWPSRVHFLKKAVN